MGHGPITTDAQLTDVHSAEVNKRRLNTPRVARVAVLWSCPWCSHWNVSEHGMTTVKGAITHGSKAVPLRAVCEGPQCTGMPAAERGFRNTNKGSRSGRTMVSLVSRRRMLPEACVAAARQAQVQRLRNVAEAANIEQGTGGKSTLAMRWGDWDVESGKEPSGKRPQPWRRWDDQVEECLD
jgi:hypothetical protein